MPNIKELIIRDYDNKDTSKSIIWAKISGNVAKFKIHAKETTGNISGSSGISNLYCTIDGKEAKEVKEERSGIFGLNKFFVYHVSDEVFSASGTHEIQCIWMVAYYKTRLVFIPPLAVINTIILV